MEAQTNMNGGNKRWCVVNSAELSAHAREYLSSSLAPEGGAGK